MGYGWWNGACADPVLSVSPVGRPEGDFLSRQERISRKKRTPRWRNGDGTRLYEWDALHAHVEIYDKHGRHLGVGDALTGELIAPPKKGRRIDVS
ncbi:colicin E3/pyocin S6 family cytotoxin [Geodermatophilus nigrescens]